MMGARIIAAICLALAVVLVAGGAFAQFNKCGHGFCPGGSFGKGVNTAGSSVPPPTGKILLVDGASFVLQTDAASKVCRAGGC